MDKVIPITELDQQEARRLLKRGVSEIIVEEELVRSLKTGKQLRLKEGFDPTRPDIHLGHMVALRKLRQFQELGHQVVLIIGDWTAQVGDPSGQDTTRPMLTAEEVKANAETYMKQFFSIVDKARTEVRFQSEWFGKFNLTDVIRLTSKFTIAQFLARDDFAKRFKEGRPITITEFLYPLLQAYDSVAVRSDVEFGGTDQKFNFLVGRELQGTVGQTPQQIFTVPLLVGTDGSHKMSKSLGNYIGVAEPPNDIYGKTMSVPDNLILDYFELLTDISDEQLLDFKNQIANSSINPMELKKRLAFDIVSQLHGRESAVQAEENFARVFQKKEIPDEVTECPVSFREQCVPAGDGFNVDIGKLLTTTGQVKSRGEASRLIKQGGVSIDGQKIGDSIIKIIDGCIIKVGKHRFIKIVNTDK
jgi:tyrosyl-tRNA synthetase